MEVIAIFICPFLNSCDSTELMNLYNIRVASRFVFYLMPARSYNGAVKFEVVHFLCEYSLLPVGYIKEAAPGGFLYYSILYMLRLHSR